MRAAVVTSFEAPPQFASYDEPQPAAGEQLVEVRAAALSQLVRAQASGKHYSSHGKLPLVPGFDGVGLASGKRVYFMAARAPFGTLAERTVVRATVPVPDSLDDATAAALANPGMSSWAALTLRTRLQRGERVLILGATGASGSLAVNIARHLGASHVTAAGRDESRLAALGADAVIPLGRGEEAIVTGYREALARGVDVVLDYVFGAPAELFLRTAAEKHQDGAPRIRFVNIGGLAGPSIPLRADWLRSSALELLGSGLGSVSRAELLACIDAVFRAVAPAGLRIETEQAPLADVAQAWLRDTQGRRLVFRTVA